MNRNVEYVGRSSIAENGDYPDNYLEEYLYFKTGGEHLFKLMEEIKEAYHMLPLAYEKDLVSIKTHFAWCDAYDTNPRRHMYMISCHVKTYPNATERPCLDGHLMNRIPGGGWQFVEMEINDITRDRKERHMYRWHDQICFDDPYAYD